jgi:hypothetical protein
MKIKIVSTFSDKGYELYGKLFVESCKKFIYSNIDICFYIDNVPLRNEKNITILKLEESIPDLSKFKHRNKNKEFKDFKWDAVRFSHKSYTMWHAAKHSDVDKLFWLDADTVLQNNIDENYLNKFLPDDYFTSYLGRGGRFTETGFIGFNLKHKYANEFFDEFIDYYNSDRIYTELSGYTDCHVYDATRNKLVEQKKITALDLTPGMGKNNFNHVHQGYMIHNKGGKKL